VQQLNGTVATLTQQFQQINRTYDPESVQKMAQEGKLIAAHEARSLVYLMTVCIAGLIFLHATLRRWRRRPLRLKTTRS
jgi:hypothetical protein